MNGGEKGIIGDRCIKKEVCEDDGSVSDDDGNSGNGDKKAACT